MDNEQRILILENDMKDAKERIGRHSARLNTLEQTQLQEKGELANIKSEMRIMDTTLKNNTQMIEEIKTEIGEMEN